MVKKGFFFSHNHLIKLVKDLYIFKLFDLYVGKKIWKSISKN